MYYFYILRSIKNQKLYLGQIANLKQRLASHNAGENKAIKPNVSYELLFSSVFQIVKDAISNEKYFKTFAGWKRLHKMLEDSFKE